MSQQSPRYFVEALGRGLALLDCFVNRPMPLTLGELSEHVGLNPATTFRLLHTLETAGYVRRDPTTRRYRLSLKVLGLHGASLAVLDCVQIAGPYMYELKARIGDTVGLAVLEGMDVRYVARIHSSIFQDVAPVGTLSPGHATASGKNPLRHPTIRRRPRGVRRPNLRAVHAKDDHRH